MNDDGDSWHAKEDVDIGKHVRQVSWIVSGVNGSNCDIEVVRSKLDGVQIMYV